VPSSRPLFLAVRPSEQAEEDGIAAKKRQKAQKGLEAKDDCFLLRLLRFFAANPLHPMQAGNGGLMGNLISERRSGEIALPRKDEKLWLIPRCRRM
jgi:hypothetical protein